MKKRNIGKETLIKYLNSNLGKDIKREDIIHDTGISNSRLSELIKALRSDGYDIITPNRSGIVRLVSETEAVHDIGPAEVRQWIILLALSKLKSATYRELICSILSIVDSSYEYDDVRFDDNYTDKDIMTHLEMTAPSMKEGLDSFLPLYTLRKDLGVLHKAGFIERKRTIDKNIGGHHYIYSLSDKSPAILFESWDELKRLMDFCDNHNSLVSNSIPLESLFKKVRNIIDWESYDSLTRIFGKTNRIDAKQLRSLNEFIQYPYKTHALEIVYDEPNGEKKKYTVYSGLLYYSYETNRFYLLCGIGNGGHIRSLRLDHMSHIASVECERSENNEFRSSKFLNAYHEMFSTAYEPELIHVKVLFEDIGNISERLEELKARRRHATLTRNNPPVAPGIPHSIVYEDDLRDKYDFARFLRGFGSSALVLEPENLRMLMLESYNKILDKYEVRSDKYE